MDPEICRVAFHGAQHGMAQTGAALAALLTTDMRFFNPTAPGKGRIAVTDTRAQLLRPQVLTASDPFCKKRVSGRGFASACGRTS